MNQLARKRLAWFIAALAGAPMLWSLVTSLLDPDEDFVLVIITIFGAGLLLWLGGLIAGRTGNPIGWIYLAIVGLAAYSFVGDRAVSVAEEKAVPVATWADWLSQIPLFASLLLFIAVFFLFPDGHLPSRRWRWVWWTYLTASSVIVVGFTAQTLLSIDERRGGGGTLGLVLGISGALAFGSAFASFASLVVRYRRADPDTRQQIRWLAFVGGLAATALVATVVTGTIIESDEARFRHTALAVANSILFTITLASVAVGIPAASAIAILRYHLYDLNIVVRKTVVATTLAIFVALVYTGVVAVGTFLIGAESRALSLVAAVVLALLFQPARERARRFADRIVFGKRATPYEVLTSFGDRIAEAYSMDDVLPRMAQVLAAGTGASSVRVLVRVAGRLQEVAATGSPSGAEHQAPVVHHGEELGAIVVTFPPAEPLDPAKEQLIRDLAVHAGLMLRNVRLIEELRASRQRLVAAQDEERRRIERNLHDGVQQQLVALNVRLGMLTRVTSAEQVALLATQLQARATETLEDLRDLARGIYPPLLADKGLAAAVEAQARKAAVPTVVETDGIGRYPQEVEAAVYFCTLEALNNVAKYSGASQARIELAQANGSLTFTVTDDGRGFDPERPPRSGTGLQGMVDRLDAIGGSLDVRSTPGEGTTVRGQLTLVGPNDRGEST